MSENIIDKIKSKGYWQFLFHPLAEVGKCLTVAELKTIVEQNAAHLRGWPFPITNSDILRSENDGIVAEVEFKELCEHWKFYKSGQFVATFSMIEDRLNQEPKQLDCMWTMLRMTECFYFAAHAAQNVCYESGLHIECRLHNCKDRSLIVNDQPVWSVINTPHCVCKSDQALVWEKEIGQLDLIANQAKIAIDVCVEMFNYFEGIRDNMVVFLTKEQDRFLRGEYKL